MKLPFGKPEQAHVDVDTLSAYLDHQIAPAERARVEGHLADCIACRDELDGLRRTVTLLQALPRVPVPRAFTLSEAQVGIRRPEPRPAWVGWTRGLATVTAIALVAVVAVSLLNRPSWQPAATLARIGPTTVAPQPAVQPAAPAESAPAEVLAKAPAPAEPTPMAKQAVAKAAAVADTAAATVAAETGSIAPTAEPAASEPEAIPPAAETADAAAEAPSLMAAAAAPSAPAPAETPAAGVMAFGRGAGGGAAAAAMPALTRSPEPTPALVSPASILPAAAGFVYTDEKSLWALDSKAGVRQLVLGESLSQPIISSDRSRVAYRIQGDDHSDLWTVRWDGTDATLLLKERELPTSELPAGYTERRLNDVRWLPGRAILAVTTVASPGSADLLPKLELWHLDVESGALQRVTDMAHAYRPFYSPDGTQIALLQYGTDSDPTGDLTLINADGTDRRVVMRFPAGPTTASSDSQIAWVPDGSGLWAFFPDPSTSADTDGTPAAGGPLNGATLYRIPTAGGEVQSAGRVDGSQVFWSPDGSRLAYTRVGKDGTLELFLANADGANPQLYASLGNGGFVNWAPDGAHFIYTDGIGPDDNGQTYVGAPERAPQLLGKSISLFDPRWISSRQLLALHDTGTNWLLVTRTLDGEAVGLRPLPHEATYDTAKP